MKLDRFFVWAATLVGGGLLLWKGWQGMALFLHDLVAGTLTVEGSDELTPSLPGFLLVVLAVALIATAQLIAIWRANSAKRLFLILRSVLLLLAGLAGGLAVHGVVSAFAVLSVSSGASPDQLLNNLSEIKPQFQAALTLIVVATLFGAAAVNGEGSGGRGAGLEWAESVGWIVIVAVLAVLTRSFSGIDGVLGAGIEGADPAFLAQHITAILTGERLCMIVLFLLGILGLVSTFTAKAKAAADIEGQERGN